MININRFDEVFIIPLRMNGHVVYMSGDTYTVIVVGDSYAYMDDFSIDEIRICS